MKTRLLIMLQYVVAFLLEIVRRCLLGKYPVRAIGRSPDGRLVAMASGTAVQVWTTTPHQRLALTYKGHQRTVYALAWSPDGTALASASVDGRIQVWNYRGETFRESRVWRWSDLLEVKAFLVTTAWFRGLLFPETEPRLCPAEGGPGGLPAPGTGGEVAALPPRPDARNVTLGLSVDETHPFPVGVLTDTGIKRRHRPNEDSVFAVQGTRACGTRRQRYGLFVVADGMGGHANGQEASANAARALVDHVLKVLTTGAPLGDEDLPALLAGGVQKANAVVFRCNEERGSDMGSTVTAALVLDQVAWVANVGDSRTYLWRGGKGLRQVTEDHSKVAFLLRKYIIRPDDVYTHPERNQLYRGLGSHAQVEVDLFKEALQEGDRLLLCSDGLSMVVHADRLVADLTGAVKPSAACTSLVNAALEAGGPDNISVIVVWIPALR